MTHLITTDLDRTMIYSRRSAGRGFDEAAPVCVETYRGEPLSYMSSTAHDDLAALAAQVPVVPTTTRTPEQYGRVELPGGPFGFAVCSNGGEILVDGEPDDGWREHIRGLLDALPVALDEIVAELTRRLDTTWEGRLRVVPGLFAYVVSEPRLPAEAVAEWKAFCAPRGWTVSQQGRKLYTIPEPVTKSRAAKQVRSRLIAAGAVAQDAVWLAAGDGALDLDLLQAADAAIRPRHGELDELGVVFDGLTVTRESGIAAGRELTSWFAAHLATVEAT